MRYNTTHSSILSSLLSQRSDLSGGIGGIGRIGGNSKDIDVGQSRCPSPTVYQLTKRACEVTLYTPVPGPPLVTFIHGDCHADNFVIARDKVYLVDFAGSRLDSPWFDMTYVLLTSTTYPDRLAHLHSWLDTYSRALQEGTSLWLHSVDQLMTLYYFHVASIIMLLAYSEGTCTGSQVNVAFRTKWRITQEVMMHGTEELLAANRYPEVVEWVLRCGVLYSHKFEDNELYKQMRKDFRMWQLNMLKKLV